LEREPTKENISPKENLERIEGVIEDLEKTEQVDEEIPKTKKLLENKKRFLLLLAGLVIPLFLIFLGVYFIYQLLYSTKQVETSRELASEKSITKSFRHKGRSSRKRS